MIHIIPTIALITARGGSKGLPRKNILPLNGKPMIAWTIEAALQCEKIDQVYVSSEDEEILNISKDFGAETIIRPLDLASDDASSHSVITHAIENLNNKKIYPSTMVLLQPTSPLRTSDDITNALSIFVDKHADCVISVFEPSHTPIKAYIENNDGSLTGLFSPEAPYTRRQDLPKAYQPNGAIYAFDVNQFSKNQYIPRQNVYPYVMSEINSIDVDTIDDLHKIEAILKGNY